MSIYQISLYHTVQQHPHLIWNENKNHTGKQKIGNKKYWKMREITATKKMKTKNIVKRLIASKCRREVGLMKLYTIQ